MHRLLCTLFVTALAFSSFAQAEENWPQFRGPGGQGISDAKNLPLTWSDTQNVKWKTPIHGKAWSSPVIWKNQIWLSAATEEGNELSVVCVDKNTGKILIDKVLFHIATPQYSPVKFNSYGSPTPIVEEGRLYITFGSPGTACLDTKDASVIWQRTDFVCNHFRRSGSSPLLWNNLLFMNFDGSDYQYCVALDKNTGKTVWKTDRSIDFQDLNKEGKPQANGDMRKAFSTPRIMMWEGKPLLLSLGSKAFYCYDAETGQELWRTEDRAAHSGSVTPVIGDGLIYTTTGNGGAELWAIKPGGHGVINNTNVVWRVVKKIPTRVSPILVDGLLYTIAENTGSIGCFDAKTGAEVFTGRIDGAYSASPIYANGRIYFCNQDGLTTVIAAGRELKVLAENQLTVAKHDPSDPWGIMGSPAVSGDAIFIRTRTDLYRIENMGQ